MKLRVEGVWCKTRTEFDKLSKKDNYDLTFTIDQGDMLLIESLDRGGSVTWEYGDPLAVK